MKNVKLTLATTLSVLALTFAGTAFADGGGDNRFNNHKQKNVITKTTHTKNVNRNAYKTKRVVKRVVVKNTPYRKVVITKTIIKKPAKSWYAKNKRFQHVKRFNKQYRKYQNRTFNKTRFGYETRYSNKNRTGYENRYKRHNRFNAKRVARQSVYSVRPGDTLIQISYKTGVSIQKLARLNRIKNRNLN